MHAQFLEGWAPAMGSGYSVQNIRMLVSVVTLREPKLLRGSSCSGYGMSRRLHQLIYFKQLDKISAARTRLICSPGVIFGRRFLCSSDQSRFSPAGRFLFLECSDIVLVMPIEMKATFRGSWSLPKILDAGHSSEHLSPFERDYSFLVDPAGRFWALTFGWPTNRPEIPVTTDLEIQLGCLPSYDALV